MHWCGLGFTAKKIMGYPVLSSVGVIMTTTGNDGKQYKWSCCPLNIYSGLAIYD